MGPKRVSKKLFTHKLLDNSEIKAIGPSEAFESNESLKKASKKPLHSSVRVEQWDAFDKYVWTRMVDAIGVKEKDLKYHKLWIEVMLNLLCEEINIDDVNEVLLKIDCTFINNKYEYR